MASLKLSQLINKLDKPAQQALEAATGLCVQQQHSQVEIAHWLLALLNSEACQLKTLLSEQAGIYSALMQQAQARLQDLPVGNRGTPSFSQGLTTWLREAWLIASLEFKANQLSAGYLLYSLIQPEMQIYHVHPGLAKLLAEIDSQQLYAKLAAANQTTLQGQFTPGEQIASYTLDLTALAQAGKLDVVTGRDAEIRQMIDILTRRRQNNPILTGEAGVGKTAIVEGLALRIVNKQVPTVFQNVRLLSLDLAALQAGAGVKGEFEKRCKELLEFVQNSPQPIILFIDEAHTLIGAGNQTGQGDAANLFKPALARGTLRTIAATTWAEYKKYFESDAALTRRFQVVKVAEPQEKQAVQMLRSIVDKLEAHHQVVVLEEALKSAVTLSMRYIPARQLPDKAVSVLDTACARVRMSQTAKPADLEDIDSQISLLEQEIARLNREQLADATQQSALLELKQQLAVHQEQAQVLTKRWQAEQALIDQLTQYREQLYREQANSEQQEAIRKQMQTTREQLQALQGEQPLLYEYVDSQAVAQVIAEWTGIPVGRMLRDEINEALSLQEQLQQRIRGQAPAIAQIAKALTVSRAELHDPRKPRGIFLLAGSSGVGKTETALTLAELCYGGRQNITVINMSEFKEPHKISMLVGSPPGYVGYGEGGILTEAVRRKPYSVILLDEMEKAHPSVQEVFYQVFDKGFLMDGEGRVIDFKNTLILMASNAGSDILLRLYQNDESSEPEVIQSELRSQLLQHFKPAFLGRVTVIPYAPLSQEALRQIAEQKLADIAARVQQKYQVDFSYSDNYLHSLLQYELVQASGARQLDSLLNQQLLPELAAYFLKALAEATAIRSVHVDWDDAQGLIIAPLPAC